MTRSTLKGVYRRLVDGVPLDDEQVDELARLLDALREQGWSGSIPADEALESIIDERGRT